MAVASRRHGEGFGCRKREAKECSTAVCGDLSVEPGYKRGGDGEPRYCEGRGSGMRRCQLYGFPQSWTIAEETGCGVRVFKFVACRGHVLRSCGGVELAIAVTGIDCSASWDEFARTHLDAAHAWTLTLQVCAGIPVLQQAMRCTSKGPTDGIRRL